MTDVVRALRIDLSMKIEGDAYANAAQNGPGFGIDPGPSLFAAFGLLGFATVGGFPIGGNFSIDQSVDPGVARLRTEMCIRDSLKTEQCKDERKTVNSGRRTVRTGSSREDGWCAKESQSNF